MSSWSGSALDDRELAVARAQEAGCPSFVDHRELLALAPDVVVVCTPHPSHPPLDDRGARGGRPCARREAARCRGTRGRHDDRRCGPGWAAARCLLPAALPAGDRRRARADRRRPARGARTRLDRRPALSPERLLRHRGLARDVGGRGRRCADEPGAPHARSALSPRGTAGDGVGPVAAALAADGGRGHGDRARRVRQRRRRHRRGVDCRAGRATHRAGRRPRPDRDRGRVAHLRAVRTAAVGAPAGGDRDVRPAGRS